MSGVPSNNKDRNNGMGRGRKRSNQQQQPPTARNTVSPRSETPIEYEEDFPTLQTAKSMKPPARGAMHAPPSNETQTATSNMHTTQNFPPHNVHYGHSQFSSINTTPDPQSLMPSTQLSSHSSRIEKPSDRAKFPVKMPKQSAPAQSYVRQVFHPTTSNTVSVPQSTMIRSNTTADNNSLPEAAAAAAAPPQLPLSPWENEVGRKLIEIILTIHESKEFVALEEVEKQLFRYFHVHSWYELRVHPSRFNALTNHIDRLKNMTLYLHVFEQIFHLCTLNDFEPYLIKFLKVDKYEDLRLGPLEKHPEVQKVFKYKPLSSNQPIPAITTGDVIQQFMEFQKENRHQRQTPFDEFLDKLVKVYGVQSRDQLAIFHRSWAYLKTIIDSARRDQQMHRQQVREQSYKELLQQTRTRLDELKEEMIDVEHFATFNQKKTPIAVFNYLTSIVEKCLGFVPQQPALYAILVQLRDDELLQYLLNISIYLGANDQPEALITELEQLYKNSEKNSQTTMPQLFSSDSNMSKKDRKKLNAMLQQQNSKKQSSNIELTEQNTTLSSPFHTSFASSVLTSHSSKPKPPISLKELCSDIYALLASYDTILTIEQLLDIDGELCARHGVASFSAFSYDEYDGDDKPVNLVSFLDKHHHLIDPDDELSIYQHTVLSGDRTELYSFIQQLSVLNNDEIHEEGSQQHVPLLPGHANTKRLNLSAEKLSAVEKAVNHKFGGSIGSRIGNQLIAKAKQRYRNNQLSIIRFEESLLDVHGLDRLNICPTSMNVDETRLCDLMLHCPLMTDLHTWFQWCHFFQPKYGPLKAFINKHQQKFRDLMLLETSNGELFRVSNNATLTTFEGELNALHIRTAVGHLCALILQEGLVTHISFNVYRTSMITWFHRLRSMTTLESDQLDPMQCILDFLMYLPELIGQSRIIEELVLRPLDDVFGGDRVNGMNARTRIWNLADAKERTKLELWGYTVNIPEWQNEDKWLGYEDLDDGPKIRLENSSTQKRNLETVNPVVPTSPTIQSSPLLTPNATSIVPLTTTTTTATVVYNDDDIQSAQAAFEHIEFIRRGFGVDSGLDSDGQSIVTNLQGMIARSLEKLSTDLYSDQGHFVLELIQNADDNQYSEDHFPTLRFIVSPERILVCNNEMGFQPSNIAAICNVGASTKGKHKEGYAGHKGIGFKSVFMVSHKPEIHSRDYHIRFDTVDGKEQIGYIRPIWLDQYEEVLPDPSEWTTCIRLPIKQETQRDRLQQNFDDIQARLLLFLNRLRQIEIINQQDLSSTNNNKRVFTRIDHAQGQIIELQEKTPDKPLVTNFWLVMKKVISVPNDIKMKLRDVKGDVDSTTIAIAYPLSGIQELSNQLPPIQPLFAYLPLRPYGFRFILQADFEIPATRQEIRRDNIWNDWLKSEMTCLLSSAYRQFQRLPDLIASSSINTEIHTHLTPIQMVKYFLKLIPSRSELNPYFNSFVDESIKLLMGIIELPVTRQNEKNETMIDWVSPSRCIIVQDSLIRKILSQDLLFTHFNCYYVHEQLALECDKQILLKLGCRTLEFKDITQLIESSYKQDEQRHQKTSSSIEQIAQWLVCLDYSLEQERHDVHHTAREKEIIVKLKQLKMIPLKQQAYLVSVDEFDKQGISLPSPKSTQFSKHLKLVLDDLPTLDEQLLDYIEDKHPRQLESIKRLLQKLGIRDTPKIQEIYRRHILSVMSDQNRWSSKSESVLIAYLFCIYEYIYLQFRDTFDTELATLRNTMVLKTRDNTFVSLGSPDLFIHLTRTYSPKMSLDSLKSTTHKFTFISDDYYKLITADGSRQESSIYQFVSFLKELNVTDFLQVTFIDKPFLQPAQLVDTQWAYLVRSLSEMVYEPFKIKDFACEEFNKLVSSSDENQTPDRDLCIQLLQYLDTHHNTVAHNYAASVVLLRADKFGQGTPIKGTESSFCSSLRQHAWIPVDGDLLCKPNEVYLLPPNSETSAFRRYVPHVDTSKLSLRSEDFVYNILRIRSLVTHQTMFGLLMKWSCDLDSTSLWALVNQPNAPDIIHCTLPDTFRQTCLDTIEQFQRIYHYLASNDETRHLLSRFRSWPVVFIPQDRQTGAFLFVHQTFWTDPTSLLSSEDATTESKGRIPILPYYGIDPTLQRFFLEILNVEFQPTIDDYLPLLANIQDINQIWKIIELMTKLAIEQSKEVELQEKCCDIAFIPCMNNLKKLVKFTDHPRYPDDSEIANLFADTLLIIKLPDVNLSTEFKEQFCSLFDIESLSKVIQIKTKVENEQPSTSLTEFYRCSIDLIQHFLLSEELISKARSDHFSTVFSRLQFLCVDRIDLSYCYGDTVKFPSISHGIDTYVDEEAHKFYILKKFEQSEMRFTEGMAHFIVEEKTSRSKLLLHIQELLQIYQKEDAQGLTKRREKLTENYEPKWTISEETKKDVPVLVSLTETAEESTVKKPEISSEMIDAVMNEPSLRPQLPPRATNKENSNPPNVFLPPLNPSKDPSKPKSNDSTESEHTSSPPLVSDTNDSTERSNTPALLVSNINDSTERNNMPSSSTSNTNDQNHRVPEERQRENDEHTVPQNRLGDFIEGDRNERESINGDGRPLRERDSSYPAPVVYPDSTSLPPPIFEQISVSTLVNFDLLSSAFSFNELPASDPFHSTDKEIDVITGRRGEAFVFQYLKGQYPNADIKWMNEETESYAPYDIRMIIGSDEAQEELIEVKTTRSVDQNTFQVSIGEVQCLLLHPSNYFIYRVYYADPVQSSTITKINKVKNNLNLQHIKLTMTIPSQSSP